MKLFVKRDNIEVINQFIDLEGDRFARRKQMAKEAFERQSKGDIANKGQRLMVRHKVASGESLSAIAQQHYGSGSKEMWMKIYNANKAIIGDNPSALKVGQELLIPTLK